MKRALLLLTAAALLLSACSGGQGAASEAPSSAVSETQTASSVPDTQETSSAVNPPQNDMGEEELMKALGLSVTEGGLPTDRDAIFKRFADYKEIGVTCVRIDTMWDTSVKNVWSMSPITRNYLEAAWEYGITLKLILPTIMGPPAWLLATEGARMEDWNGRLSVNTVSYWYDGIEEYCDTAVRAQLAAIVAGGWSDVVSAVIVDMGPAGEPLYPPAWTQVSDGLDNGGGAEVMWCYAENARADFRAKMQEKYGDIATANRVWGTSLADFAALNVPKPGEAKGALWQDTLEWYFATKREFMEKQVDIFKAALQDVGLSDCKPVLYLPGADFTEQQWNACIAEGNAISQIMLGCDNQFTAKLAYEKGCLLQYTGINDSYSLRLLREYMYQNGLESVAVLGENAGDAVSAGNLTRLKEIIMEQKIWGIDYTHSRWLYEADGVTHSARFDEFADVIDALDAYLDEVDITVTPDAFGGNAEPAAPEGDILRMDIQFNKPAEEDLAYLLLPIASINLIVEDGDTLEYDVKLGDDMQGIGSIDGNFSDGKTIRDHFQIVDSLGLSAHPNTDLSNYCYPDWYHRVIKLGNAASDGNILSEINLAVHPHQSNGAFTDKRVTVYYDNIVIKRDGKILIEIFRDEGDIVLRGPTAMYYADATVSIEH